VQSLLRFPLRRTIDAAFGAENHTAVGIKSSNHHFNCADSISPTAQIYLELSIFYAELDDRKRRLEDNVRISRSSVFQSRVFSVPATANVHSLTAVAATQLSNR